MIRAPRLLLALAVATAAALPGCRTGRGGDVSAVEVGGDTLAIEVAAARYLLRRQSGSRVTIDPAFAAAEGSRGLPTHGLRPNSRSEALADAVNARVSATRESGGIHLILSEPQMVGDNARLAVTIIAPNLATERVQAETFTVSVSRNGSGWEVTNAVRRLG